MGQKHAIIVTLKVPFHFRKVETFAKTGKTVSRIPVGCGFYNIITIVLRRQAGELASAAFRIADDVCLSPHFQCGNRR